MNHHKISQVIGVDSTCAKSQKDTVILSARGLGPLAASFSNIWHILTSWSSCNQHVAIWVWYSRRHWTVKSRCLSGSSHAALSATVCNCLQLSATPARHDTVSWSSLNFMNFDFLWRATRYDLHVWGISLSPVLCTSWSFPPASVAGLNNHGWKNWSHWTTWTSCQKSDHLALDISTFQKPWSTSCGTQSAIQQTLQVTRYHKMPAFKTLQEKSTKDANMLPWQSQIVTEAVY